MFLFSSSRKHIGQKKTDDDDYLEVVQKPRYARVVRLVVDEAHDDQDENLRWLPTEKEDTSTRASSSSSIKKPNYVHVLQQQQQNQTTLLLRREENYELPSTVLKSEDKKNTALSMMEAATPECSIVHKWQEQIYPTCNVVHEMDFFRGIIPEAAPISLPSSSATAGTRMTTKAEFVGHGATRDAWRVRVPAAVVVPHRNDQSYNVTTDDSVSVDAVIVKTLRLPEKEYEWLVLDRQRIDATVSEHLTSSKYVLDVYGYCGAVSLNEAADTSLYRYVGWNDDGTCCSSDIVTPMQKLVLGRDIAYALADVHESHLVWHDTKPKNIMISNGKIKIGDFNNVHFLTSRKPSFWNSLLSWDKRKHRNQVCPYHFTGSCQRMLINPNAEECRWNGKLPGHVTEKIEVFQLGLILHFLLVPEDYPYNVPMSNPPRLPTALSKSQDPAVKALEEAATWALSVSSTQRPKTREVADFLAGKISQIRAAGKGWQRSPMLS